MKRILLAGLFALLGVTITQSTASAQVCSPFSGGLCFKLFGGIHSHGPLYNYGPYTGYYPFEPYGPWNAQLQYTGPYPSTGSCGWNGCGLGLCGGCGRIGNGLFAPRSHGCDTCGNVGRPGLFSQLFGSRTRSSYGSVSGCDTCGTGLGLGHGLGHGWLRGNWGLSRFAGPSSALGTQACGSWGCGNSLGWSDYARTTFRNIFHRTHPCTQKATCPVQCGATCGSLCK